MQLLLTVHAFSTIAMTGVIGFVQVVHYPLFHKVGSKCFPQYHAAHTSRTGFVVVPLMLAEAGTAAAVALLPVTQVPRWQAWLGLILLLVAWVSTFGIQVPLHRRLASGYDAAAVSRLVGTNWIRTVVWTARGLLALLWLR